MNNELKLEALELLRAKKLRCANKINYCSNITSCNDMNQLINKLKSIDIEIESIDIEIQGIKDWIKHLDNIEVDNG